MIDKIYIPTLGRPEEQVLGIIYQVNYKRKFVSLYTREKKIYTNMMQNI